MMSFSVFFHKSQPLLYVNLFKRAEQGHHYQFWRKLQLHFINLDFSKQHTADPQPHRYRGDRGFFRQVKKTG